MVDLTLDLQSVTYEGKVRMGFGAFDSDWDLVLLIQIWDLVLLMMGLYSNPPYVSASGKRASSEKKRKSK